MYYYIFDVKKCRKRSQVEEIKNYLYGLGISGEFTYPSGAQSVEELVDLGLSKKYNTIVAIGGDEVANRVAGKLCGRSEAMGIIPLEASLSLTKLIGTDNWRQACDNLRFRKISELRIGKTASGSAFLTSIDLDLSSVQGEVDGLFVHMLVTIDGADALKSRGMWIDPRIVHFP